MRIKTALTALPLILLLSLCGPAVLAAPPAEFNVEITVAAIVREERERYFGPGQAQSVPEIYLLPEGAASFLQQFEWRGRALTLWRERAPLPEEGELRLLLGGEFPVPIYRFEEKEGRISSAIAFKEYGLQMNSRLLARRADLLSLEISTAVSTPDLSRRINFASYIIPALTSRRTKMRATVGAGQALMLAGLLADEDLSQFISAARAAPRETLFSTFSEFSRMNRSPAEIVVFISPSRREDDGEGEAARHSGPQRPSAPRRAPDLSDDAIIGRSGFATSLEHPPVSP